MTKLYLVRHGPTHAKTMVGWSDVPADLSDIDALDRMDAHLPDAAAVISSDLSRTARTADALQRQRTRLPHDPQLREMHFGQWELRSYSEIEAEAPDLAAAFWQEPGAVRPPGGESWHDMRARADAAIDRLIAAHTGRALIVVTHFGVILGQLERALDVPTTEIFGHRIEPLSVTELTLSDGAWAVGTINHQP